MTAAGWLFMILSWGCILAMMFFSYYQILHACNKKKND